MTDSPNDPAQPEDLPLAEGKPTLWDRVSLIWLIPIVALAVALGAAYRNYAARGPVIHIAFDNAAGVAANETELRYRDVAVGVVESVAFGADLERVVVSVRVDPDVADYIDEEARFWVVRPEVSARGVSGLDTVLSGVYIRGVWDTEPGTWAGRYEGLDAAPLLTAGQQGVEFTLRSSDSLPTSDTPILFKGVEVGMVDAARIAGDGLGVEADAVIYGDYASLVTSSTRFWDISGFNFTLGATGARLNFTSFASLIQGGVTFETLGSGGAPIEPGAVYELFPDEEAARDDFLVAGESEAVDVMMVFEENLSGLTSGAAVELGGLRVGEVVNITGIVDRERFGDSEVRLLATARLSPSRIGLGEEADEAALFAFLEDRIADGLRARLTNASILTGGLKVELVDVFAADPAELDMAAEPFPRLPTASAQITDVTATAQGVLQRVSDLPIEEVMQSAISLMDNATTLIGSQALQDAPDELLGILAAVRGVAESDDTQGIPGQISGLIADLQGSAETLTGLVEDLRERDVTGTVSDAVAAIGEAAGALPGLIEDARGVVQGAGEVPFDRLSAELSELLVAAQTLLAETEGLIAAEDVQAVPGELRGLLASARTLVDSEDVQGLPAQVSGLLSDLGGTAETISALVTQIEERDTAGTLTDAVEAVGRAADSLPPLVAEAQAVVARVGEVPLSDLSARLATLLTAAEGLLGQVEGLVRDEALQAAPEELRGLLAAARGLAEDPALQALPTELSGLVEDLRVTAGTVADLAAGLEEEGAAETLTGAVRSVGLAAERLPALIDEVQALAADAGAMEFEALGTEVRDLLAAAELLLAELQGLVAGEAVQNVPVELRELLASARGVVESEDVQGLPTQVSTLLDELQGTSETLARLMAELEAQDVTGKITRAVEDVEAAAEGLPALVEEARGILDSAGEVQIEELAARATDLIDAAERLIDQEATRALPSELNGSLAALRATLQELRAGGLVENANATLASARNAAQAIAEASRSLPALSSEIQILAGQAGTTLAAYSADAEFSRDARAALRQVEEAAAAVEKLARTIERNPNSLILGR
ncbi:MlaD family protein [Roseivivax sp. CAU 1761]